MKRSVLFLFVLATAVADGQNLVPDNQTSRVGFEVKNFGVTVSGSLSGLAGTVSLDPDRIESSFIDLYVQASSIETGISLRNKHLKKEEFFDAEHYPELRISSVSITKTNSGSYVFMGSLKIKAITRKISFPFTIVPSENGFDFIGMFTINRLDYEVGGNSLSLSDNVLVKFQIRTVKRLP